MTKISVIIPAYNEAEAISETIDKVRRYGGDHILEIIVVDGGSTDQTAARAQTAGAQVMKSFQKGRAAQMNYGANMAGGQILYFLHADSHPPKNFGTDIISACKGGADAGCFRLAFDHNHFLLRCYAWFTRFDIDAFRFGDQSLFVKYSTFAQVGGFREDHTVMEDQEFVRRVKREYSFHILSSVVTTSARKYEEVGFMKLQLIFLLIFTLYYLGTDQQKLVEVYDRWVS